jgi:hypothetical protein
MEILTDLIIVKTPKTPQIELKYSSGELSLTAGHCLKMRHGFMNRFLTG